MRTEAIPEQFTAFVGQRHLATGTVESVVGVVKAEFDAGADGILVFRDRDGSQVDFDLSGSLEETLARISEHALFASALPKRAGPGRPRLGVISRELSLLPRHWDWLEQQSGGASATVRRLVETASRAERPEDSARQARDAAGKFMWTMAGNLPNFEEATRALYAGDRRRLALQICEWPADIRDHVERLLTPVSA